MEYTFLSGTVNNTAGFIKCFFNSFSVTCGNSFSRAADSRVNGRFYLYVSGVTGCVFFHRFDIGFNLRQWIHLPKLQEH